LNGIAELVNSGWAGKYMINSGVDHGLSRTYYNERLVEIPFLFKHITGPPAKILDVGCSESIVPVQLAMMGYDVVGIDIRDHGYPHRNFTFLKSDFLKHKFSGKFDVAVDISATEHFGLESYGNAAVDMRADRLAVKKIHALLKSKGQFIFTAPFGVHEVIEAFERVYDMPDLKAMFGGFKMDDIEFYKVLEHKKVEKINQKEASLIKYSNDRYGVVLINATRI
jgi:SAM-dependent methyltransferase